jgi:hypothetical protein
VAKELLRGLNRCELGTTLEPRWARCGARKRTDRTHSRKMEEGSSSGDRLRISGSEPTGEPHGRRPAFSRWTPFLGRPYLPSTPCCEPGLLSARIRVKGPGVVVTVERLSSRRAALPGAPEPPTGCPPPTLRLDMPSARGIESLHYLDAFLSGPAFLRNGRPGLVS